MKKKKQYFSPEADVIVVGSLGMICQSIEYGDGGQPGGSIGWDDDDNVE